MKKIGIVPLYKELEKNKMFFPSDDNIHKNLWEPYIKLKEDYELKKIQFETIDCFKKPLEECDLFIFFRIDWDLLFKLFLKKKLDKTIYIQLEPPCVTWFHEEKVLKKLGNIFGKIITWNDALIDNKKFFKFNIPMYKNKIKLNKIEFENKLFLCNISGNKSSLHKDELYSERIRAIKFFEEKRCIDLFGVNWKKEEYKSYKGKLENKLLTLNNYKFSLCFENQKNLGGYITEKIFECFYVGVIPVYLGANNIEKYVPEECYIDFREYNDYQKVYKYLKNMSKEEYLARIQAIENYLVSEEYKNFLSERFIDNLEKILSIQEKIKNNNISIFKSILYFYLKKKAFKLKRKFYKIKRSI